MHMSRLHGRSAWVHALVRWGRRTQHACMGMCGSFCNWRKCSCSDGRMHAELTLHAKWVRMELWDTRAPFACMHATDFVHEAGNHGSTEYQ